MAVSEARKRSYIEALMYLGKVPKVTRIKHAGVKTSIELHQEADAFKAWLEYDSKLQAYFLRYVCGKYTEDKQDWIEGFLYWQQTEGEDNA